MIDHVRFVEIFIFKDFTMFEVDTDWSVNVCNGYVREYCEAFCEKKKPLYEERDKANAKDAKKVAPELSELKQILKYFGTGQ